MTEEEIRKIINKLPDSVSFQETHDYILEKLGKNTSFEEALLLTYTYRGLPKHAIDEAINNIRYCNGEEIKVKECIMDGRDHSSMYPSFCSPITFEHDYTKKKEIERIKEFSASFDFDKVVREQLDKFDKNFYKGEKSHDRRNV